MDKCTKTVISLSKEIRDIANYIETAIKADEWWAVESNVLTIRKYSDKLIKILELE